MSKKIVWGKSLDGIRVVVYDDMSVAYINKYTNDIYNVGQGASAFMATLTDAQYLALFILSSDIEGKTLDELKGE